MFATNMNVPTDYLDEGVGQTTKWVLTILLLAICAGLIGLAVRQWVRHRDAVLAGCLIGGALATVTEPFYDVMGGIWHFEKGVPILFTWADRGIPLHIGLAYVAYIGGSAYMSYWALSQPWSTKRKFLIIAGTSAVLNAVFEGLMTAVGLYAYYGDQPLQLWHGGFPLGWMANNIGSVLIGALLYGARDGLRGPRGLLALFVIPSGLIAWEFWCGWPMFAALNADGGYWVTYPAMGATVLIAVVSSLAISNALFPNRSDSAPKTTRATPTNAGSIS